MQTGWDWSSGYAPTRENLPKGQRAGILLRWTDCGFRMDQMEALVAEMSHRFDMVYLLEAPYYWNDNLAHVPNREEAILVFLVEIVLVTCMREIER